MTPKYSFWAAVRRGTARSAVLSYQRYPVAPASASLGMDCIERNKFYCSLNWALLHDRATISSPL